MDINNIIYNPSSVSDIKFADKKASESVAFDDFLKLMLAQLQNQDFTNPVDDSEYLAQIAQFSMLQQMQEVTKNSQYNFAASLLGRVVSVQKTSETGQLKQDTGYVDKVSMSGDELVFYINDDKYTMGNITQMYDNTYYITENYKPEQPGTGGGEGTETQ